MNAPLTPANDNAGIAAMIIDAEAISDHGHYIIDPATINDIISGWRVTTRIVVAAASWTDSMCAHWRSKGWEVISSSSPASRRVIRCALNSANRIFLATDSAGLAGAPAIANANHKVIALVKDAAVRIAPSLRKSLCSVNYIGCALFPLAPALNAAAA